MDKRTKEDFPTEADMADILSGRVARAKAEWPPDAMPHRGTT
jgi:hypothetical protein